MTISTSPKNVETLQNMLSDWSFLEKFIQFWVQSESELWTILMNHCVETHFFLSFSSATVEILGNVSIYTVWIKKKADHKEKQPVKLI